MPFFVYQRNKSCLDLPNGREQDKQSIESFDSELEKSAGVSCFICDRVFEHKATNSCVPS